MAVSEDKLNAFLGKAVGDLGASVSAVLMLIGDELGLYTALAGHRLSAEELAQKTGTNARYIREWLANQAAGGYIEYDETSDTTSDSRPIKLVTGRRRFPGFESTPRNGGKSVRRPGART